MRNDHKHTPAYGRKAPRFLLVLLLGFLFVSGDPKTSAKAGSEQVGPPVMRLTWLSIARRIAAAQRLGWSCVRDSSSPTLAHSG